MNNKKENPFTFLFQDVTWDTSEIQPTMDVQYVLLEPTVTLPMQIPVLLVQKERLHQMKEVQAAHSVVRHH